jgi:hypothetical protein
LHYTAFAMARTCRQTGKQNGGILSSDQKGVFGCIFSAIAQRAIYLSGSRISSASIALLVNTIYITDYNLYLCFHPSSITLQSSAPLPALPHVTSRLPVDPADHAKRQKLRLLHITGYRVPKQRVYPTSLHLPSHNTASLSTLSVQAIVN